MHSTRFVVVLWLCLTVLILGYALLDLQVNPWLREERAFSMQPDFSRVGELAHWGGRLLRARALPLLVCNAVVLGGLLAIPVAAFLSAIRRSGEREREREIDARPSLPPR